MNMYTPMHDPLLYNQLGDEEFEDVLRGNDIDALSPSFTDLSSPLSHSSYDTVNNGAPSCSSSSSCSDAPFYNVHLLPSPALSVAPVLIPALQSIAPKQSLRKKNSSGSDESGYHGTPRSVAGKRAAPPDVDDERAFFLRKQRKMENNRRHAKASRDRKAVEQRSQNKQVDGMREEIHRLQTENVHLQNTLANVYASLHSAGIRLVHDDQVTFVSPSPPVLPSPPSRKSTVLCAVFLCTMVMFAGNSLTRSYTPPNLAADDFAVPIVRSAVLRNLSASIANATRAAGNATTSCQYYVNSTLSQRNHVAIKSWAEQNKERVPIGSISSGTWLGGGRRLIRRKGSKEKPLVPQQQQLIYKRAADTYYVITHDATVLPPMHTNTTMVGPRLVLILQAMPGTHSSIITIECEVVKTYTNAHN